MGYGAGHLLVPDELKDQRFGLRFLVRRLDFGQVNDLVRRRPDARAGTYSTLVPAGGARLDPRDRGERGDHQADGCRAEGSQGRRVPPPGITVRSTWKARSACGCGSPSSPPSSSRTSGSASASASKRSPTRHSRSSSTSSQSPMPVRRTSSMPSWRDCSPGARTPPSTWSRSAPMLGARVLRPGAQLHAQDRPRPDCRGALAGTRGLPPPHPAAAGRRARHGAARRAREPGMPTTTETRSWPAREPTSGSRPACPSDRGGSS